MTELPIPASAKEKARDAWFECAARGGTHDEAITAALRAAFDELGMEREYRYMARSVGGEGGCAKCGKELR